MTYQNGVITLELKIYIRMSVSLLYATYLPLNKKAPQMQGYDANVYLGSAI